jgi:hypothetical protein
MRHALPACRVPHRAFRLWLAGIADNFSGIYGLLVISR